MLDKRSDGRWRYLHNEQDPANTAIGRVGIFGVQESVSHETIKLFQYEYHLVGIVRIVD